MCCARWWAGAVGPWGKGQDKQGRHVAFGPGQALWLKDTWRADRRRAARAAGAATMVTARSEDGQRDQWARSTAREAAGALPAAELVEVINGFVRLAAERYRRAGLTGEAIRVYLYPDDRQPVLHIADYGPGMAGAESTQAGPPPAVRGEARWEYSTHRGRPLPHSGSVAQECEVITLAAWARCLAAEHGPGISHYTARADAGALTCPRGYRRLPARCRSPDLLQGRHRGRGWPRRCSWVTMGPP